MWVSLRRTSGGGFYHVTVSTVTTLWTNRKGAVSFQRGEEEKLASRPSRVALLSIIEGDEG